MCSFSWFRSLRTSCKASVANLLTPVAIKALSTMLVGLLLFGLLTVECCTLFERGSEEFALLFPLAPVSALIALVWVLVLDNGNRTSSVRSHKQSWVSWPTEPNRYVTLPFVEFCLDSLDCALFARSRFPLNCAMSSSLPLNSAGASQSWTLVMQWSNATTLTHDLCPRPRATTLPSENDPNRDEIVFPAGYDESSVGAPTNAQQPTEVAFHRAS